jgi:hypothetical protein
MKKTEINIPFITNLDFDKIPMYRALKIIKTKILYIPTIYQKLLMSQW